MYLKHSIYRIKKVPWKLQNKKSQITLKGKLVRMVVALSVQTLRARGACNDAFQILTEDSASPVQYW